MSSFVDRDMLIPSSPESREQFQKIIAIIESLQQENGVLKMELDTFRMKIENLQEEKDEALRQSIVDIYANAEQEEEFMYNILLKQIQTLKQEKETLALKYRRAECLIYDLLRNQQEMTWQEEESISNTLHWHFSQTLARNYDQERKLKRARKLNQRARAEQGEEFIHSILRKQGCLIADLSNKLNQYEKAEQEEVMYNTFLKQIKTLINEKEALPLNYEQERRRKRSRELNRLRREKFHPEQTLEEEQEVLVNKPMRKIEKLQQFFRKIFRK